MKRRLLLMATVLALLLTALAPSVVLAAKPTQFSATIIPTDVQLIKETPLGNSGRVLAEERIFGVVVYSDWDLSKYATVDILATTNYIQYATGEREGVMRGRMTIYSVKGGTLELTFAARISGLGGNTFDGLWTAVGGTGVFEGINARGTFFSNPAQNVPPTLVGTYN